MPLHIELLGKFRITRDTPPIPALSTRLQSLIAYLVLHAGTPIPRHQIAFLFWPDSAESQARTNLRQLLHHLRTAIPDLDIFLDADTQSLTWREASPFTLDTALFEHSPPEAAAALYHGDLLPALYDEWIEPHRRQFAAAYDTLLERLATLAESRRDFDAAIRHAETRLARDPLREAAYQTLIRLHAAKGDRAGALRIYQRCADTLRRELGVDPGAATQRARDLCLTAEPAPAPTPITRTIREIPLLGRDAEWAALVDHHRNAAAGRPAIVVLTGEPGIGKTRLLEELLDHAEHHGESTARASCYAAGQALAYTAVAEWLRSPALRPTMENLPAVEQAQLARVLPEILTQHPDLAPPRPFTEAWQRRHFFEALARAILKAAPPLILAIDDLQWCDPETVEWLQYLIRFDRAARLLIVATARQCPLPEHAVAIPIGPLDHPHTLRLAARLSPGIPDAAAESLYLQTGGNPLFVVESVRAGLPPSGVIPPKVHAVITARLAQLTAAAQQLAGVAAVIGRPFTVDLAAAIDGTPEDAAAAAIDELWKHRVLQQEDSGAYDFTHGCLRDAAYAAVGPARRALLHRRAAEALEALDALNADAVIGQIALHYERAGLPLRAIPCYQRAADLVRRRFAEADAIASLYKALRLLEKLPPTLERERTELDLLLSLGPSLSATQGYASEETGKVYSRARLLCELLRESDRYFPVLAGSWSFHVVRTELEVSGAIAGRYLALAEQREDPLLLAAGNFIVGANHYHTGNLRKCRQHLETGCDYQEQSSGAPAFLGFGPEVGVFCHGHLAHALFLMGHADLALEDALRSLARAESLSHPFSLALALAYLASLHQFRDEPEPAMERAEAAATVCRKYGFRYYLSWTPIIAGWARARLGEREAGLTAMLDGYAELRATGACLRAPYYLGLIAQASGWCGDSGAGLRHIAEAREAGARSGEDWIRPELERIHGDLLRQSGHPKEAETCYRNAIRLSRQVGARAWEIRARNALAAF